MVRGVPLSLSIVFSAVLLFACGCSGENGPQTVRVAGTLYLDGKPLEGAEVRFIGSDFVGYAMSGPDGKYELVQGAIPGENVVTVQKIEGDFELDPEQGYDIDQLRFEMESAQEGNAELPESAPREVVPVHFSDPERSNLKYNVPESGTTSADLRLSSK